MELRKTRAGHMARVRTGGLMFYVCAFATIVNVILYYVNFYVKMPCGLHTTQYYLVEECKAFGINPIFGAVLCVLAAGVMALMGYFAREKKNYWVFSAATVLYAMDILNIFAPGADGIFSMVSNTNSVAAFDAGIVLLFDVYAAIMMFMGFRSIPKINEVDYQVRQEGLTPIPDNDDPAKDMSKAEKERYEKERKKGGLFSMNSKHSAEESVVAVDMSAAWPEPAKDAKKAKAQRIAKEAAEEQTSEQVSTENTQE